MTLSTCVLWSMAMSAACTANAASSRAGSLDSAMPRAGNLPSTGVPDRDVQAIAALRAEGRDGLLKVLREYDRAAAIDKPALAATVDAVAAQRYATVSRLFWYTDLAAAKAEALRSGRPILALRMLGRLDEDLSCANSRFFRTALYSNREVADLMRDQFVLLWTSEREVPRVTIEFGDGRSIVSTVTGNSIHYVLDFKGRVIDALPGLYAPSVFTTELKATLAVAHEIRTLPLRQASQRITRHLEARQQTISSGFATATGAVWMRGQRQLLAAGQPGSMVAAAQRATMSKFAIEVPLLAQIAPGTDPGAIDESDIAAWATVGQAMFGIGEVHPPQLPDGVNRALVIEGVANAARRASPPALLDARARALVAAVFSAGDAAHGVTGDPAALLARFEQRMMADTALNQLRLRPRILAQLAAHPGLAIDELNRWVYDEVFLTPGQDPWLGLLARNEFTGLPGDGVVVR